ncbi:MAG: conjugal transfer protein MobA [Dysgonomonas sp.]
MSTKRNESRKGGRIPKRDPAKNRHVFYLNDEKEAKFLSSFESSGAKNKAHFITSCIFNNPVKVVKIDKGLHDYYMRLTTFFGQFRAIGVNYNQVVKALNSNFSEKKALAFLYKLEKATIDLVDLQKKILALTNDLKQKISNDGGQD